MRTNGVIGIAALSLLGAPAAGQPTCAVEPCTPAIAINNHAPTADDFPADSIRQGEQGTVRVRYLISETGDVVECAVTESSGYVRLDDAACAMIRSRWKYKPATEGGKTTTQNTTATIVFRYSDGGPPGSIGDLLNFQNASRSSAPPPVSSDPSLLDPSLDVPTSYVPPSGNGQPTCASQPCIPAIPITSHEVTADDYPYESIQMQEQGETSVRFVIDETGNVTECMIETSSGYPRLDVAACAVIRDRWKYKPATLGGKAVSQNTRANVVFVLSSTFTGLIGVPERSEPSASDPGLDIPDSYVPPPRTSP